MSASTGQQVASLEQAIMDRANDLAEELLSRAHSRSDAVLRETVENLRLAEERETSMAKGAADRSMRRQVQANELKQNGHIDQLRWELVLAVQSRLVERMQSLQEDRPAYTAWLQTMLTDAASLIPGDLLAEVNADDHAWLEQEWDALVGRAAPGRRITLSPQPTWGSGGVKVRSIDNRAQVDNRFEGRLARYQADIQRVILERLFPGDLSLGRTP